MVCTGIGFNVAGGPELNKLPTKFFVRNQNNELKRDSLPTTRRETEVVSVRETAESIRD